MIRFSAIRSTRAILFFVTFASAALSLSSTSHAQGCVAARGAGLPASQFGAFSPREEADAPAAELSNWTLP
jgi:hypothetical protein